MEPGTYPGEILRCTVGSELHGVNRGSDDHDEMGIFIPSPEKTFGLHEQENYVWRSAWDRTGTGKGTVGQPRSIEGDTDLTLYSLRKFIKLAANGNPSILLMFFVPREHVLFSTTLGMVLQNNRELFITKSCGKNFMGYLKAQLERLKGERGQKSVRRPELVEQFGYDTKYAYQALRLGLQGIELMRTGKLTLPMTQEHIMYLNHVRQGKLNEATAIREIEEVDRALYEAYTASQLPQELPKDKIDRLLVDSYLVHWDSHNMA